MRGHRFRLLVATRVRSPARKATTTTPRRVWSAAEAAGRAEPELTVRCVRSRGGSCRSEADRFRSRALGADDSRGASGADCSRSSAWPPLNCCAWNARSSAEASRAERIAPSRGSPPDCPADRLHGCGHHRGVHDAAAPAATFAACAAFLSGAIARLGLAGCLGFDRRGFCAADARGACGAGGAGGVAHWRRPAARAGVALRSR